MQPAARVEDSAAAPAGTRQASPQETCAEQQDRAGLRNGNVVIPRNVVITVVIAGDLAAVTAAVEAGRQKVEGLGKLVAAHVLARPSKSVLGLLPKLS